MYAPDSTGEKWAVYKVDFYLTTVDVIYTKGGFNSYQTLSVFLDNGDNTLHCIASDSSANGWSRVTLTVPRQFLIDSDEIQALYDRVMSEGINA
jgi:hypothetical protein